MPRPTYFPTQGHLLLCQGPSCTARGSSTLFTQLIAALEHEHLAYYKRGGAVRLTASGCLGACSFGPTLACYRTVSGTAAGPVGPDHQKAGTLEQAWYFGVNLLKALELARAVQEGRDLPLEGRYDVQTP